MGTEALQPKTANRDMRIAVIGVIIEDLSSVAAVNEILHHYGEYIIGRMGLPYREKGVNIISIVMDAPSDAISALSGKLGRLPGVSSKALYSRQKLSQREQTSNTGDNHT